MKLNRRNYHRCLVIREKSNKRLSREVDQDWPIDLINYTRAWHKPKYHGTKFRGGIDEKAPTFMRGNCLCYGSNYHNDCMQDGSYRRSYRNWFISSISRDFSRLNEEEE